MRMKKIAIALLALGSWLAVPSHALGATDSKPAWKLVVNSLPTNFIPGSDSKGEVIFGPEYLLLATNVAAAPTSGEVKIEDTLPTGITPLSVLSFTYGQLPQAHSCEISGQTVTCTELNAVPPSRTLQVKIPVKVELPEGALAENEARIEGGEAPPAIASTTTPISSTPPSYGFLPGDEGLSAPLSEADGSPATQAGSHPYQLNVNLAFPTASPNGEGLTGAGHLRDAIIDLPPGEIVNPSATPKCTEVQLESSGVNGAGAGCPAQTQIGVLDTMTNIGGPQAETSALYNMVPPPGVPAAFGFNAANFDIYVHILGAVRSNGDYGLSGRSNDILARPTNPIFATQVHFWGDPGDKSYNAIRGGCLQNDGSCPNEEPTGTALLTAPAQCTGQPSITNGQTDSWEEPGVFAQGNYESADLGGTPVSISGCNQLEFKPTIEAKPTTNLADSPSGLDFDLHQPQNELVSGTSPAIMKDTTVVLPEGMTVNPSSADGQSACEEAQANLHSLTPSACPAASKLASAEVRTPLLEEPLTGALYLAKPFQNPFGSLLAIYLSINDPERGVVTNLAGEVTADPLTGQLTTRFAENPQLPLEDVRLHLFTGPRAALRTPTACDSDPTTPELDPYTTTTDITPWSAPETADAHPSDSFAIQAAPGGGSCPSSAGSAPNSPSFSAGTIAPQAGAYSPFVLRVKREDATQPLAGIDTTLPPGLTGKLAGIPYCSEAQIAQAQGRDKPNEGAIEQANPSCPSSSEVGTVDVAAGAGITPLHVAGHAYLAGPYKGAPLSLAIITPAIAGPFDLGAVTVRTALYLNPETAQIHAVSDPLPQILEGIPLDVRQVSLKMGKPEFTLNPTSCDPMQIAGTLTSALGQSAALSTPFQVGGCNALGFSPKLAIRLKGQTKRTGHPALTATASFKAAQANTRFVQVTLPRSEFLDQAHIGTVCTRVQFAANQCPVASVYGEAQASTPLLDQPLSGPVYLRSSNHELPDLVIALNGQVDVVLDGRIDSVNGGIRTTFEAAPDAPVRKFTLKMQGGKKGLLINSANLCKLKPSQTKATVLMEGQNGKAWDTHPVVKSACAKAKKHKKKSQRKAHHKHSR
jgi:hypothetical protein